MKAILVLGLVAIGSISAGHCQERNEFLLAHWPFDGSLADASGRGHDCVAGEGFAAATFAEGRDGEALRLEWQTVSAPDEGDLQLAPGLRIDCWVYFDEDPQGYQIIAVKDDEYQLRVDADAEGGTFSFFVHFEGWEPCVRSIVPEAGTWYHVVAGWTGTESYLEVDGERHSVPRVGMPKPTENPLVIGKLDGRVEDLKLHNPGVVRLRRIESLVEGIPAEERSDSLEFTTESGWADWRTEFGATMAVEGEGVSVGFPDGAAMLVNPALDARISGQPYVSLDISSPTAEYAELIFVTEVGSGTAMIPVTPTQRTSIVNMLTHPMWRGKLRLLGLSLPGSDPSSATIEGLWLSDKPRGKPFVYVRSLAPGRAVMRSGRDEQVIAVLRNLAAEASDIEATLRAPEGVRVLGKRRKSVPSLAYGGTRSIEWTVRADGPGPRTCELALSVNGAQIERRELPVVFEPPARQAKASYVPRPEPVEPDYLTLMHYCPLWKQGTHYGWQRIEPWPERKPAIGWYDEGTPEVADWQIKYALEHGIQGFIYCWYRKDFSPEITQNLGYAIHDGLLNAKYLDQFRFTIMWENGCAKGIESRDDMMENLLPYWIENYFTHPSYVVIDNKPLLYVWRPERLSPEVGGSGPTRELLDEMRDELKRHGFDGLYIVGCVSTANEALLNQMAEEGWDASSAYAVWGETDAEREFDVEGIPTLDHRECSLGQEKIWRGKKAIGALPDIPTVMMGWDPRPWHGGQTSRYQAEASPENFREACLKARKLLEETPGNGLDKRIVAFDNWNEFGEGHYLEPCSGYGFGFVDAIRDVFCQTSEPCEHVTPSDVGLETPDRVYRREREILGVGRPREHEVVDNLIAHWSFDKGDDYLVEDSSGGDFDAIKQDYASAEGLVGQAFECRGGSASLGAHPLMFPLSGITVEMWMKTDTPDQTDRWMLNTVGRANTGYRLGLTAGRLTWQLPLGNWSHSLRAPEPLPLGEWTHVAGTYDNEMLRLFVNGELVGELERLGAIQPSGGTVCIGSYSPGTAQFIGLLDEVKLHDRPLTADEMAERHGRLRP